MSPQFGTAGNLSARTAAGNLSISAKAAGVQPSGCHATEADSMPEQTERYRSGRAVMSEPRQIFFGRALAGRAAGFGRRVGEACVMPAIRNALRHVRLLLIA